MKNKWLQAFLWAILLGIVEIMFCIFSGVDRHTTLLLGESYLFFSKEGIYRYVYFTEYSINFFMVARAIGLVKFEN